MEKAESEGIDLEIAERITQLTKIRALQYLSAEPKISTVQTKF